MVNDRPREGPIDERDDLGRLWSALVPFVEVAQRGSFRGAAVALGLTPAAISKSIKRLEAGLGARLFARTSRSVRLTSEGEAFLPRAREAIAQLRAGQREVEGKHRGAQGLVRISISPILSRPVLPELARLAARHEGLRFDLRVSDRIARLVEDRVDVALRVGVPQESGLTARKLLATRWQLVASPSYLARRGTPRGVDELAAHDFVRFVGPGGRPRELALRGGTIERAPLAVDDGELTLEAARQGMGIAQVLDFMTRADLASGALVSLLPEACPEGPAVHAVHVTGRRGVARVRLVVAHLAEAFARI